MAWLRFDDGYNRRPEIRVLDDATYRALKCLIEAAEHFDGCGMVSDDYVMTTYPHARQKLRSQVRKLADRGLVHLLSGPDDRDHDCVSCLTRWEELRGEGGEELREKWGTSSSTSSGFGKTEPMWFCVRNFFDVALTPEQKRNTKQGNAKRQRTKRQKDKAAESRRDAQAPSHPPVPVPVPGDIHIDPTLPKEDAAPASTAGPWKPSDALQELIERLAERRKHAGCKQPKWKDEYREHLEAVVTKALEAPGDTRKILNGALDGFFADPTQRKFLYSPAGLDHGFDRYAAEALEQEAEAFKAQKRADRDAELAAIDAAIFAKDEEEKAERRRQRAQNGAGSSSGKPTAEIVAEAMRSLAGNVD